MNAIAFCLYGNNPKYLEGMIQNAWLMPRIYPEWECHCWFENTVPTDYVVKLDDLGVRLHLIQGDWKQRMFYRLLIHDIPGVERYLVRDSDSRISMRERRCVDQWMVSGKILHSIHDHFYHQRPIQGGMFGIWRKHFPPTFDMKTLVCRWADEDKWGRDEEFLEAVLWPIVKPSVCEHGKANPIPPGNDEDPGAFIGEIYDAQGNPEHPEHRTMGK